MGKWMIENREHTWDKDGGPLSLDPVVSTNKLHIFELGIRDQFELSGMDCIDLRTDEIVGQVGNGSRVVSRRSSSRGRSSVAHLVCFACMSGSNEEWNLIRLLGSRVRDYRVTSGTVLLYICIIHYLVNQLSPRVDRCQVDRSGVMAVARQLVVWLGHVRSSTWRWGCVLW